MTNVKVFEPDVKVHNWVPEVKGANVKLLNEEFVATYGTKAPLPFWTKVFVTGAKTRPVASPRPVPPLGLTVAPGKREKATLPSIKVACAVAPKASRMARDSTETSFFIVSLLSWLTLKALEIQTSHKTISSLFLGHFLATGLWCKTNAKLFQVGFPIILIPVNRLRYR